MIQLFFCFILSPNWMIICYSILNQKDFSREKIHFLHLDSLIWLFTLFHHQKCHSKKKQVNWSCQIKIKYQINNRISCKITLSNELHWMLQWTESCNEFNVAMNWKLIEKFVLKKNFWGLQASEVFRLLRSSGFWGLKIMFDMWC